MSVQTPVSSMVINVLKFNNEFNTFQSINQSIYLFRESIFGDTTSGYTSRTSQYCRIRQISYKCEIKEDMTVTTNAERRSVNDQISFLQ
jgi:hypothetical protein